MPICNDDRSSIMVSFAPKNILSASEDMAGMKKISIAIDDKRRYLDL